MLNKIIDALAAALLINPLPTGAPAADEPAETARDQWMRVNGGKDIGLSL